MSQALPHGAEAWDGAEDLVWLLSLCSGVTSQPWELLPVEHPQRWQPKSWRGHRELPWAGGDTGAALVALAPPSCSQDSVTGWEPALPPHTRCLQDV